MFPLAPDGPYYAIILGGGTLDTKGGPVINTKAQVINTQGNVIAGLYGAGNCIASPAGQAYWSGGGTLGPALTYGRIAGTNAAAEPVKEL
jgi:succinate dehydrogenase/fumarate reductase flavoprotein subunit